MAEVKKLEPIPALYDYVLFYECGNKDWKGNAYKAKISIKGDGSLMNSINWRSTYSLHPNDSGGKTMYGITESTWKNFVNANPKKGYSSDVNSIGQQEWMAVVNHYWFNVSHANESANYACAFTLFNMGWHGFSPASELLSTLKKNADIKDYKFTKKGGIYAKIADATHAYTNPMVAYNYMRKAKISHDYNSSSPGKKNKDFRMGWLTKDILSFTQYGLFIPTTISYSAGNLKYSSSIDDWENVANKWSQESNKNGYVKILDWGVTPEEVEQIMSSDYSFTYSNNSNGSTGISSGAYGGSGGVSQLGSYTNSPSPLTPEQIAQSREYVLNTLINGSQMRDNIAKCLELITVDKKKGVRVE